MMSKRDIEFLKIVSLRGPNMWTYRPVLEAWINIHGLEDANSSTIPGFYERLSAWLPSLEDHRCSYGEQGGFLRRVKEGTWPGHILSMLPWELQNLAGLPGGFGKARGPTTVESTRWSYVPGRRMSPFRDAALHAARDLIFGRHGGSSLSMWLPPSNTLTDMAADSLCLGPSTACIVEAATETRHSHNWSSARRQSGTDRLWCLHAQNLDGGNRLTSAGSPKPFPATKT